jgi:hypothetical protein
MKLRYATCAGIVLVLAGCAGVGAESTLKYDGTANGTHSETPGCDDQGKLKGSGNVPDGQVLITLKDSAGKQLMQQSFKGEFTFPEQTVTGASGTWSLAASRSGDDLAGDAFAGNYAFYLNC